MKQPWQRKRFAAEALVRLLWAWCLVRLFSFRKYADKLGQPRPGEIATDQADNKELVQDIRWAVNSVSKNSGGLFTCLMRAMAGKAMLNRRGIPNSLVLGAKLNDEKAKKDGDSMAAHAWLWAGTRIILGASERHGYLPVTSYFSDPSAS